MSEPSRAKPDVAVDAHNEPGADTTLHSPRWAIIGIFFILLGGALYLTASFILPVTIALLFALVLSPIVRFFHRRLKVPDALSAAILVIGTLLTLVFGFYMLSGPFTDIVNNAPSYIAAVEEEVDSLRSSFSQIENAQDQMDELAEGSTPVVGEDQPQEVVVKTPGIVDNAATAVPQLLASTGFALVFLFFLLASGDLFYQKLVKAMPTLSDKKKALHIAHTIERELSRYLFTITLINLFLGIVVSVLLWWAGMPSPAVFGALATVLNFIPYIGALIGAAVVGIIALAEFGSLHEAMVPLLLYFACTSIEGQLVTPMVLGRRLEMNAAAIFLAVAFWGWIWGVVGMFLAVPLMVGIKIFATYVEPLHPLADFLSVEKPSVEESD